MSFKTLLPCTFENPKEYCASVAPTLHVFQRYDIYITDGRRLESLLAGDP
jgi:hypothetical protein